MRAAAALREFEARLFVMARMRAPLMPRCRMIIYGALRAAQRSAVRRDDAHIKTRVYTARIMPARRCATQRALYFGAIFYSPRALRVVLSMPPCLRYTYSKPLMLLLLAPSRRSYYCRR
jgi:hypothetical protein